MPGGVETRRGRGAGYIVLRHVAARHILVAGAGPDPATIRRVVPMRAPESVLPLSPAMFHILMCLAEGDRHGYRILKDVAARTGGRVELSTGTLYGIIKRLLDEGLVTEVRSGSERRRAYRLTSFGTAVARAEAARLDEMVAAARATGLLSAVRKGRA